MKNIKTKPKPKTKKKLLSPETRELNRELEDLAELEKFLEELSIFLPLPFCGVSPMGVIVNINRAFSDLTGYIDIEIVGEKIDGLFSDKKEAKIFEEKIIKKEQIKGQEIKLATKSGKELIVNVSASLRKDKDDDIIGYFLAFSDITELKAFQRQLEEKVAERTQQLQVKIEEMERFNKLAVGRELKMIELKKEIEKLKEELQKNQPSRV